MSSRFFMTSRRFLIFGYALLNSGCGGLPENFGALPLDKQVAAYERNFDRFGGSLIKAQDYISWHGWAAADLMADYIAGRRSGLPQREAIQIIYDVQSRGCSLKGTAAERALKNLVRRPGVNPIDVESARNALAAISKNEISPDEAVFAKEGPCEAARRKRG
jgi:hypothetical protein